MKPPAQVEPSSSAQTEAHDEPLAQVEPSTSAQTEVSHEPLAANNESSQAIEILDFSNVLPEMPKNIYIEFFDIFHVEQPDIKKLKEKEKKKYDEQMKIYRKRKWEHIGRNISQAEKEAKKAKAKALKEGYVMSDDGKTQFTIKAYHGVKRGYYGRVYQVAVEFMDNVVRWVNPEELINARTSLNQYLDKVNIPNLQINIKKIKLSVPDSVFVAKQKKLDTENALIPDLDSESDSG